MTRSRTSVSLALLLLVAISSRALAQATKRPMTIDDGFRLVQVGGGLLSPDGRLVMYSRTLRDFDRDSSKTTWWLAPTDGSRPGFQFLGGDGDAGLMWARDSKSVYFLRTIKKVRQLHQIEIEGGEAIPLTEFKENEGQWSLAPNGKTFVIRRQEKDSVFERKKKDGWDHVFVNEGPNGQNGDYWANLWTYEVGHKEPTRLTQRDWAVGGFDISPDSRRIVVAARTDNMRNTGGASELYLVDVASREVTRLTDNQGPEGSPVWAPDNKTIVFDAVRLDAWDQGNGDLWLMDTDTRRSRNLTAGHKGSLNNPRFSPDGKSIYVSGGYGTARYPRRVDVTTGAVEDLTSTAGLMNVTSWSDDRSVYAYTYQDFTTPPDLYIGKVGTRSDRQRRVTDLNPWVGAEIAMGTVELAQWKSAKGMTIEGLVHLPPGHEATRPATKPLMLNIHGGPAGAWTNNFSVINHVYTGMGYVMLSPNVRGSTGYDDALMRGNMFDIGGGDYQDLITGVDALIAKGTVHKDSLALRGWSYGGILGGWTITQTDRFKAASVGAMVSDWVSEYGPGFNFDVSLWYIGGDPWSQPEKWRRMSPLTHVNKVKTPTLVLHGDNDLTDTPAQSMNFFAGLQKHGVTARYIRFPGEPHGLQKMKHQRTRDAEEVEWMQKYLRGLKDYRYPERPDPKKEAKVVSE
jgi:dipeptidyl aminopeptidase/acylaminoacyl peptidase